MVEESFCLGRERRDDSVRIRSELVHSSCGSRRSAELCLPERLDTCGDDRGQAQEEVFGHTAAGSDRERAEGRVASPEGEDDRGAGTNRAIREGGCKYSIGLAGREPRVRGVPGELFWGLAFVQEPDSDRDRPRCAVPDGKRELLGEIRRINGTRNPRR
jgi:hypothetical protein